MYTFSKTDHIEIYLYKIDLASKVVFSRSVDKFLSFV